MEKAEDYINISELSYKSNLLREEIIERWIKQAQIDTIEATVKKCADSAYIIGVKSSIQSISQIGSVDRNSILQVAEQLKKELE